MEDTREILEIDIDDKDLLALAKMAHDKDITLNTLINNLLRDYMKKEV